MTAWSGQVGRGTRTALGWAALVGLTAVAAGAFGAHRVADPRVKAWLQTGAEYGLIHALAAIAAIGLSLAGARSARAAAWMFLAGASIFSGSLYLLALSGRLWLGAITPIGGVLLLAGWAWLAWTGFRFRAAPSS